MEPPEPAHTGQVRELFTKLQLEEKIRDGAQNLLHEIESGSHNKLKPRPTGHKKQTLAQLKTASSNIELLREQLRELGFNYTGLPSNHIVTENTESSALAPDSSARSPANGQIGDAGARFGNLFDSLDPRDDPPVTISRVKILAQLLTAHPLLRTEFAMVQICDKIRQFLLAPASQVLSVGFRLARLILTTSSSLEALQQALCLDLLIARSLSKGDEIEVAAERAQALLLVRSYLSIPGGIDKLPPGVIRAVAAVAEYSSDRLQHVSMETLAEIAVLDPHKAHRADIFPTLIKVLRDGPSNLTTPVTMAMANFLDRPSTRKYLRGGQDMDGIMTVFTDNLGKDDANVSSERLKHVALTLCILLRSWSGLSGWNTETLIRCLVITNRQLQETLLDVFCVCLSGGTEREMTSCFTNHFTAMLLQKLLKEGLVEKLIAIQESDCHKAVQRKAQFLIGHIFRLSTHLLPPALVNETIGLVVPNTGKTKRTDNYDLSSFSLPIFQVDNAIRGPTGSRIHKVQYYDQIMSEKMLSNGSEGWVKIGGQIDDLSFKKLINATHLLTTKTFTRWNWDALLELIQGPLHNPKRLDEAIKTTKFMKRLVSFYRPFKYRFSSIKESKQNRKYVHVGRELVATLLHTAEGRRYIGANKLLRQIAECLAQLDPSSGITSEEPLFSPGRLANTLSCGYFEILGEFSKSHEGQQMLSQQRIFNMFYHVCDTDREDVMRLFISSMDYSINGHPRLILAKALTCAPKRVRRFATEFLQTLAAPASVSIGGRRREEQLWAVDLLVSQLFDPDMDVCKAAVESLLVFCGDNDGENLDHLIALRPGIGHLSSVGGPLYMLFLSRPAGFEYLCKLDFVHQEMDHWLHGFNEKYVIQIEDFLQNETLNIIDSEFYKAQAHRYSLDGRGPRTLTLSHVPRHFFGDLVLTEQGCKLLEKKGYVNAFSEYMKQHCRDTDPGIVMKLKGCLWALGHIGSKTLGSSLIGLDIVQAICAIYLNAEIYSLRGTAFYSLGLISSSFEGAELLNQCGWTTTPASVHHDIGIALILSLENIKQGAEIYGQEEVDYWPERTSASDLPSSMQAESEDLTLRTSRYASATDLLTLNGEGPATLSGQGELEQDFDFMEASAPLGNAVAGNQHLETEFPRKHDPAAESVLSALSDLSNHVLANEASLRLVSLRAQRPVLFQNLELFKDAVKLLSNYRYKQLVRRFIFELFDTSFIFERMTRRRSLSVSLGRPK